MSETEWEEAPEVYVPRVRRWLAPAIESWTRGCYPRRQGIFLVWGWFIPVWGAWSLFKFMIYASGIALMLAAYPFWVTAEMATYRHRRKRALLAA